VNPLCLWLVGPSGRGKTTAGTLAQCFFGRFERTSDGVSCGSTAGSIEITAHEFRGALLHIDDAKGSAISPGDKPKLLGAFQRLHDRTARGRLNSNSTAQRNRGGRATILVSGEDTLFDEASIRGRYLDIEVEHPQAERTREALEEIRAVRPLLSGVSHALVGHLLAEPGWGRRVLSVYQERWRALEQGLRHGDNAPRVAASMAALSAGWRLLPELAGTRGIIDEDVIRKEAALFDSALAERGNEQVHTSTEMTPAGRFIEDLQTLISSREARIDDLTEGDGRAPRIGFMKEGWVCVLPRRTVELINGKLHADGDRLPRAETVGRSLRDIGALGRSSGGRCGWRTEDPAGNSKPSVWALVPECLRSGPSGEEDE
jgi:hypothetical protein